MAPTATSVLLRSSMVFLLLLLVFSFFSSLQIEGPMHCPTRLVLNDKETEHPLPEPCLPLNFTNSTGLRYEAEEVRRCLLKGRP